MDSFSHVPPGFRFHPTEEELVDYYLRKKVESRRIDLNIIKDVDLYKIEPWDLQEVCRIGKEEQSDWYFFSHKDKKYPTGTRTNRATTAGFWKATGRDKPIYSNNSLVGMRKTLVFYRGRAPNGQKSDWIMHEYRLETNENAPPQEEGWAVCRVFKKKITAMRAATEYDSSSCSWYSDHIVSFVPDLDSSKQITDPQMLQMAHHQQHHHLFSCKPEQEMHYHLPHDSFLQLPQLAESPKFPLHSSIVVAEEEVMHPNRQLQIISAYDSAANANQALDQTTDWRLLDKLVASQLISHDDDICKECKCSSSATGIVQTSEKYDDTAADYASTSNSMELWK